jgi:UDP-N-acetylglucosamine 2-epimerase (non-hydrolysing)
LGISRDAGYGVVTLHRPSNVDDAEVLARIVQVLCEASERLPLVFPVHPRTRARIDEAGLNRVLDTPRIATVGPLGYLELLGLMAEARVVLTDSGGIQEETTALGVPCLTLRENTERPITVEQGTNTVTGTQREKIIAAFSQALNARRESGRVPELWDGCAAIRIAEICGEWLTARRRAA